MAASAALGTVACDILMRAYSSSAKVNWDDHLLDSMLGQLDGWHAALPPYLKPDCPAAPTHFRAIRFLHLRYHQYIMLLTRPFLLQAGQLKCRFSSRCEEATRVSVRLLTELTDHKLLSRIHFQDSMFILACGMILFAVTVRRPTPRLIAELSDYRSLLLPFIHHTGHISIGLRASEIIKIFLESQGAAVGSSRYVGQDGATRHLYLARMNILHCFANKYLILAMPGSVVLIVRCHPLRRQTVPR